MPPANPRKPEPDTSRNEYIPSFISKKPFYVADDESTADAASSTSDYLEHQRLQKSSQNETDKDISTWYARGQKAGKAATKFRKGACENCGAMTHKTKDCLSRPRKQGAKWTGRDIEADEVVSDVSLGWDAKRDRWNGYDAREYAGVVEEYNALEEMKGQLKAGNGGSGEKKEGEEEEDGEEEADGEDGVRYAEETDMGRQQSTSTRQLRLREDTAKYLLNLDLDSAKYDPKTRSMVDAGANSDAAAALVAEEGFMKASGDAAEFDKAQRYAWETQERGGRNQVHLQANPTAGEQIRRKDLLERETTQSEQKKALLDKYGDQTHLRRDLAKMPAVVESHRFVEYDERGLIKGGQRVKAKSSYAEDVMINNHTSVWGSWWKEFKWGYACCHSTTKNSYCTGEEGIRALEETDRLQSGEAQEEEDEEDESVEVPKRVAWREEAEAEEHVPNGVEDDEKSKRDLKARKRTLDEMRNGISDADMDEYRRKRTLEDDPMKNFLNKDELVH